MGTSCKDESPVVATESSVINRFYTNRSWVEGAAEEQLRHLETLDDIHSVSAFPDLHPGKFGPVGVAVPSSVIRPAFIGNDIGCGMSLFHLSMKERKLNIEKASRLFRHLVDDDFLNRQERLVEAGFSPDVAPFSLGTVGGGNHFCELLGVETIFNDAFEVVKGDLLLLVHSGSRSLGEAVFSSLLTEQRMFLDPGSTAAQSYLASHDLCVKWASFNRLIVAERAACLLGSDIKLLTDVPHNLITYEDNRFVHRKGAALARPGDFVPIAGSRASLSFLVEALPGVNRAHNALSHGAGRKYDRAAMRSRLGKTKSEREALARNKWGGLAICEDRNLLVEEAASAYKSAEVVVDELRSFDLVRPTMSLHPLITFKRANFEENLEKVDWKRDRKSNRKVRHD